MSPQDLEPLPPDVESLLAGERGIPEPPAGAQEAVLARIAATLQLPGSPASGTTPPNPPQPGGAQGSGGPQAPTPTLSCPSAWRRPRRNPCARPPQATSPPPPSRSSTIVVRASSCCSLLLCLNALRKLLPHRSPANHVRSLLNGLNVVAVSPRTRSDGMLEAMAWHTEEAMCEGSVVTGEFSAVVVVTGVEGFAKLV